MGEGSELILEVETDRDGRVVVQIQESDEDPAIPWCCATCLGEPAGQLSPSRTTDLQFPYCETCVPRPTEGQRRLAVALALVVMILLAANKLMHRLALAWLGYVVAGGLVVVVLLELVRQNQRRRRNREGVELLLSESHTIRVAFENPEYARRFLEANGVCLTESQPPAPADPRDEEFPLVD